MIHSRRLVFCLFWSWLGLSQAAEPPDESATLALRPRLHLVTAPATQPYLEALAGHFVRRHHHPEPLLESHPPATAAARFCAGAGADHPDLLLLPRRISHGEYRRCQKHGAGDLLELTLGREVLVLAMFRGQLPVLSFNPHQLYLALAAEVPREGGFQPNPYRTWRELDPHLPDLDIQVWIPARGQAGRALLDDRVLQTGCRAVPEVRALYEAAARMEKCLTLRTDGRVRELPEAAWIPALEQAPEATLAMLPLSLYQTLGRRLTALACEGVLPGPASLQAGDYPLSRPLYLYAKISHTQNRQGYAVARGLNAFLHEIGSETATDPGGDLDRLGLALLTPEQRIRQRLSIQRRRSMIR